MNRILATLSSSAETGAPGELESVRLYDGGVLYEPGAPIDRVYFPIDSVVSIVQVMEEGAAAEVGMVGPEGVSGLDALLRDRPSTARSLCQVPGEAKALPATTFRRLVQEDPALRGAFFYYAGGYCAMLAQLIACNRLHRVEQRCARWLLMTVDRLRRFEFPMTQDRLSMMLGAQRPTVTATMMSLRDSGCLEYNRGEVRITDRERLQSFACECYALCASYFDL